MEPVPWHIFKTQFVQKVNVQKLYYHNGKVQNTVVLLWYMA